MVLLFAFLTPQPDQKGLLPRTKTVLVSEGDSEVTWKEVVLAAKVSESGTGKMNSAGLYLGKSARNNGDKTLFLTEHQRVLATVLSPSHALSLILTTAPLGVSFSTYFTYWNSKALRDWVPPS